MTLKGILELLDRHPEYRGNVDAAGGGNSESGVTLRQGARAVFLASLWYRQQGPILVITPWHQIGAHGSVFALNCACYRIEMDADSKNPVS